MLNVWTYSRSHRFALILFLYVTSLAVTAQPSAKSARPKHCCIINETKLWQKELPAGLQPAPLATIAHLFNYSFLTPERNLGQSLSYYGPATRLRKFVFDLLSGSRPLKVGIVGGSITTGVAAETKQLSFFSVFCDYISSVAKNNMTCRNGGIPGTPTSYMVLCYKYSVDPDVDLVFVEYVQNDPFFNQLHENGVTMTTERLLRQLLDLPSRPAVVLVQSARCHATGAGFHPYFWTSEFPGAVNSIYYDVPTVSPHVSLFRTVVLDQEPGFDYNSTYTEYHPGNAGHRAYADTMVHLIQHTALDLVHQPLTLTELQLDEQPPTAPIVPGNVPPASPACVVGEDFIHLVKAATADWSWVNEGKPGSAPKWGYVSNVTGGSLEFEVDTVRPHRPANATMSVFLYYLASYASMGVGLVECVKGCACNATEMDAHIKEHYSQTYSMPVDVTQHRACRVRVTVMNKTSSGQHKFKIVGAVVTEQDYTAPWAKGGGVYLVKT